MSSGVESTSGGDAVLDEAEIVRRRRRRRWSPGRIVLNLIVVVAFAGAVFALYSLIEGSGVLGGVEEVEPISFDDVPPEYAESGRILEAVEKGLVLPAAPARFGPADTVTRGEFAGVVVRTLGWDVIAAETHTFADVAGDPDVIDEADSIAVVATKGVMGGAGGVPPTFAPADPVQVRHVLVVFVRAADEMLPAVGTPDREIDALPVSAEIRDAYQRLAAAGILDGVEFDPADTKLISEANREQVAIIAVNLQRFLAGE